MPMPRALDGVQDAIAGYLYSKLEFTAKEVAYTLDVTESGVLRSLRRQGIPRRGVGARVKPPADTEWRDVPGFPDYAVSIDGQVMSTRMDEPRLLTPQMDAYGYLQVCLYDGPGEKCIKKVHHMILEAFGEPRTEGMECRHLDGDRQHNHIDNLCWGTSKENSEDMIAHGRSVRGEAHHASRLTQEAVREIRRLHREAPRRWSQRALARKFGVDQAAINAVIRGHTWAWLQ